jgi:hypothetical protein
MGYITVSERGAHVSLHFAGEIWIFAVLTLILLIITGGSWGFWEWRRLRRQRLTRHAEDGRVTDGATSEKIH